MSILKVFQKTSAKTKHNYNPIVPSGLIAHTESGYFYIKAGKKFKFISDKAMHSWGLPVIKTLDVKLNKFIIAGTLGFRDGTLIKDFSDGKIYLISDSKRRHVTDPDVLEWLNSKIIEVGQKEIFVHDEGEQL
jgi:hypothetical protein